MMHNLGAIQMLCNAVGGGGGEGVSAFPEKALQRCTVQRF